MKKKKKKKKNQRLTQFSHMSITHFQYWTFELDPKALNTRIIP